MAKEQKKQEEQPNKPKKKVEAIKKEIKKEKTKKKANKMVVLMIISLSILLLVMGSYYIPPSLDFLGMRNMFRSLEESSINWRFASKALTSGAYVVGAGQTYQKAPDEWFNKIYIAGIDGDAIEEYGLPPFDRKVYANIISNFNQLDESRLPKAIFFDVIFGTYSGENKTLSESDIALVNSFSNYRGVLAEDFILESSKGAKLEGEDDQIMAHREMLYAKDSLNLYSDKVEALRRFELPYENLEISEYQKNKMIHQYNIVDPMIPELARTLDVAGPANIDNSSQTVRKKPLVFKAIYYYEDDEGNINLTNVFYPDIILALAAELLGAEPSDIIVRPGEVVIQNAKIYEFDDYNRLVDTGERGDHVIPVDERFRLNINYKATEDAGYVKSLSLKDIDFTNANRYGLPNDAVIIIGAYAHGLTGDEVTTDIWQSPIGNMYGTLHLAFALGTVMNKDFILEVPEVINIIYMLMFTLGIALLISRGIKTTIVAGLISVVIPLLIGFLLFQFNIDIIMMLPLISAVLMLIAGEIYMLLTEEKEKRYIKSTFSSYVSPDLVDILVKNPGMMGLGGVSKDLTILFSDIRSFTTLSEGMTPEYLINFLNVYLTKMTNIVMDTKGTLDKYIGDAVMAFWGAPIELENNALESCRAALLMMDALKEFNNERAKEGDKPIDIGIGLNSGFCSVGNVGSEKRKNYTVIGDAVNLASRLEGANKFYHTHIIISEFTYEKVKEHVIARELDLLTVKGKHLPVKIYELWDIKGEIKEKGIGTVTETGKELKI